MAFVSAIPVFGEILGKILDRIPDPTARAKAAEAMQAAELAGELEAMRGQLEINKVEAASSSVFVSGWRPFIGWVCGAGLTYQFVLRPFVSWACAISDLNSPPNLDAGELMPLVVALLGLGGYRTYEKVQGVADPQTMASRAAAVAKK